MISVSQCRSVYPLRHFYVLPYCNTIADQDSDGRRLTAKEREMAPFSDLLSKGINYCLAIDAVWGEEEDAVFKSL